MSYILDALNKSEQERKEQNYEPSLQVSHAAVSTQDGLGKPLLWVFAGLIVVLLACIIVYFFTSKFEKESAQPRLQAVQSVERSVADAQPSMPEPKAAPVAVSRLVSRADVGAITAPGAEPIERSDNKFSTISTSPSKHSENKQSYSSPDAISSLYQQHGEDSAVIVDAYIEEQGLAIVQGRPSPGSQELLAERAAKYMGEVEAYERELEQEQALQAEVQSSVQEMTSSGRELSEIEKTAIEVPHISEMSESLQAAIPSIEFSAHVYAFDASAGFVILNGATRYPGDRIAEDIVVEEIIEKGVVLSYKGTSFRLDSMRDWINN